MTIRPGRSMSECPNEVRSVDGWHRRCCLPNPERTDLSWPDVLARLGAVNPVDEYRVVQETARYLLVRQRADELPTSLELDDVAAALEGCIDDLRGRLEGGIPQGGG